MPHSVPAAVHRRFATLVFALAASACAGLYGVPALAQAGGLVTGTVVDAGNGQPIAGARVHEQAVPTAQVVVTDAQGRFALPVPSGASSVPVAASLTYDPDSAVNYRTDVFDNASDGDDIVIPLDPIPGLDNLEYQPVVSTDGCRNCHADHWNEWKQSNHSGAAFNALVRDLYSGDGTGDGTGASADGYVFTALHDPEDTGFCAVCHAPNERPEEPGAVKFNEVASAPGLDGVTCTSCHQLHRITDDVQAIHLLGNAEFRFPLPDQGNAATEDYVWGPLDDVGFERMRASYAPVFSTARLCASCHEYVNPFTGALGQETFSEWQQSPAAASGIQCQDCHMPIADAAGTISGSGQAPVRPPEQRHDHGFPGVYSGVFGAPVALQVAVDVDGDAVTVATDVHNLVQGHDWPTGVDFRNAFLVVEASVAGQPLQQIGGDRVPDWASDDVAGRQDGDFGGFAGRGYAKVLEGRINGTGDPVSPVNFIDAESLLAKTTIPAGETDSAAFAFALPPGAGPGDVVDVRARVIYRRAWRAIAVTKQWPDVVQGEPFERVVADVQSTYEVTGSERELLFADGFEPTR